MSRFSRTLLAGALALALTIPGTGCADESAAGKSYVIYGLAAIALDQTVPGRKLV